MPRIIDGYNQNIVGANIKKLRLENNWSQKQISDKLEVLAIYVCRGSVSRIECGTRTVTDIEVYGFAKIFDVSISDLFDKN
jgi:transcriptional regulator with XRE-family HTH domain